MKSYKLGDICDISIGFVGTVTTQYEKNGIPFFRTLNIKPYCIDTTDLKTITNDFHLSQKKSILHYEDIAMVHTGVPGICCVVPKEFDNSNCIDMLVLKPKKDLVNPYYLMAYMNTIGYKHIEKQQVGCVQKHFNLKDAIDLEVILPNIQQQNKIGDFIKLICKKIDNNKKIIRILNDVCKKNFDSWFINANCFNEKGELIYNENDMIYNSELDRKIPKDWNVGNMFDIATFTNGLACQKYPPLTEKKLPVIKIAEMHNGYTSNTNYVDESVPKKYLVERGNILFSWSATLETMIWNDENGILNQHIFKVEPVKYSKNYTYLQLSSYIINFIRIAQSRKTTMGHITIDHLKQSRIPLPPKEVVTYFDKIIDPICEIINNTEMENNYLIKIRDEFLYYLINNQIKLDN